MKARLHRRHEIVRPVRERRGERVPVAVEPDVADDLREALDLGGVGRGVAGWGVECEYFREGGVGYVWVDIGYSADTCTAVLVGEYVALFPRLVSVPD